MVWWIQLLQFRIIIDTIANWIFLFSFSRIVDPRKRNKKIQLNWKLFQSCCNNLSIGILFSGFGFTVFPRKFSTTKIGAEQCNNNRLRVLMRHLSANVYFLVLFQTLFRGLLYSPHIIRDITTNPIWWKMSWQLLCSRFVHRLSRIATVPQLLQATINAESYTA